MDLVSPTLATTEFPRSYEEAIKFLQTKERGICFARLVVCGLPLAVLDLQSTARLMIAGGRYRPRNSNRCLYFTSANGEVIARTSSLWAKRLFQQADLISVDGMSLVFASRFGSAMCFPERVATTDLFWAAARVAEDVGASFYFLGGTEAVNAEAVSQVSRHFPKLKIAGRQNGYFPAKFEWAVVNAINDAAPDVLWVGLGVPYEQRFILQNRSRLTAVGVAKSCGGLFDFLAGKNRRAPSWLQNAGLEWAFRCYQEPRRLLLRYLSTNPVAAYRLWRTKWEATDGAIGDLALEATEVARSN